MSTRYHAGKFPPRDLDWLRIVPLLGPASAAVARYEGLLPAVPNASVLLSPLMTQEAVLSSRIEGTQATFGDVLEFEASGEGQGEKAADIQEVINYREALKHSVSLLEKLPLTQRVIKEAHQVLMQGVRRHNKAPGEYRRIPNWIGSPGSTADTARYVPVGADQLPEAMSKWEHYIHEETPDLLAQLAILHAEFEAIHPFLDGNGRLGRLLVPLYLVDKKLISRPSFYISAFMESHRDEYYDRLLAVSRDDDWTGWCIFFLTAITRQAKDNQAKALSIINLYAMKKEWIVELTRSQYAVRALDWFFSRPIFNTSDFIALSGVPKQTATRIVRLAREGCLLREIRSSQGRRPMLLAVPELLNIVEGRAVI